MKLKLIQAEKERAEAEERRMDKEIALLREKSQLGLLQQNAAPTAQGGADSAVYSKLPMMTETEDLSAYLHSFERVASLQCIEESKWAKLLPSLLNSAMRLHHNRLSISTCADYRQTKASLFNACRMNARFYLEKFKTLHRTGKHSYTQFLDELNDVFNNYLECKDVNDFEALRDCIIMEILKESLPNDTKYFVEARKPQSSMQVAEYADLHFECSRRGKTPSYGNHKQSHNQKGKPWGQNANGLTAEMANVTDKTNSSTSGQSGNRGHGTSFYNRNGYSNNVHQNQNKHAQVKLVEPKSKTDELFAYGKRFTVPLFVNNMFVNGIRDTGAHVSLIRAGLVDELLDKPSAREDMQDPIKVQCAFGVVKCISTCQIRIWSPDFQTDREIKIKVGIVKDIPVEVLIGHDIFVDYPELTDPVVCRRPKGEKSGQIYQTQLATRRHDYGDFYQRDRETLNSQNVLNKGHDKEQTKNGTKDSDCNQLNTGPATAEREKPQTNDGSIQLRPTVEPCNKTQDETNDLGE